ncbi:hypothetical protein EVA_19172, partial [gut metagenome]
MAELLLIIYMIPVILVFSLLLKLAMWIIINGNPACLVVGQEWCRSGMEGIGVCRPDGY